MFKIAITMSIAPKMIPAAKFETMLLVGGFKS